MATTLQYTVTGMTCSHCESAVRQEVEALDGVQGVEVSAASGTLRLTAEDPERVSDDAVIAAVDEAGYEAVRAS
ncbi:MULTISPECIES: heavy-metal-associated domain-containing protein [unclassified Nesterenkonia]|uniref:heavy-metal-associated domain-containing protein n=1 Tax=unclassified Nesterenkonia TaxID=2629769 RepID=UPI000871D51D|nr:MULTISPECIES: heavy-metal-associated domain-containing protein [unclassified Nesterenkonia]MDS2173042.1 heavy-metal-associated domain-containing protein [Nesterenkonia sp. CL21]OSM43427.1 branched-chain amino acid ABC transporter permease [Nesterenkonia sp. PF2B19]